MKFFIVTAVYILLLSCTKPIEIIEIPNSKEIIPEGITISEINKINLSSIL